MSCTPVDGQLAWSEAYNSDYLHHLYNCRDLTMRCCAPCDAASRQVLRWRRVTMLAQCLFAAPADSH